MLNVLRASTHHLFLVELQEICRKEGEIKVVQARYVDGGLRVNGLWVITGSGVSSGLDLACYFVSQSLSPEMASFTANIFSSRGSHNEHGWCYQLPE